MGTRVTWASHGSATVSVSSNVQEPARPQVCTTCGRPLVYLGAQETTALPGEPSARHDQYLWCPDGDELWTFNSAAGLWMRTQRAP